MERTRNAKPAAHETAQGKRRATGPEDAAELEEGLLSEFAVTTLGGLRLREKPDLEAPVIEVLPCGAGVFGDGVSGPDGWIHVRTGRLSGWMMARHLERLPPPELGDGAE